MTAQRFDAIVIGSGVTGGWAAKELTEAGLKTLMLDRGRMLRHRVDYSTEGKAKFELPYRGEWPPGVKEKDFFRTPGIDPAARQYYASDRMHPYVFDEDKPFNWIRADIVGGKSLLWGRQSYRWSDLDFEANRKDGHGIDWPVRYRDIEPWYSYVENVVGIAGEALGLPQLPDSDFLPPIPLNIAEEHFKKAVAENFDGRAVTIGRSANLTEGKPEQGRAQCQYRAQCHKGCSLGAYFSTQSTTLPMATATGNLTLIADKVVESLEYDAGSQRVTGVRVVDANTKERTVYRSRIVFLCASCIASTQILLNSRSEAVPNGLGNNHDVLGRYLLDHTCFAGATGYLPGYREYVEYGRRPTGMYIPRFRNIDGQDEDVDFVRGYNFQSWGGGRAQPEDYSGFGADLKARLRVPGPWFMPIYHFGETLPHRDNRMWLDDKLVDRYNIPQIRFDFTWRDNEKKMVADAVKQAEAMMKSAGCYKVDVRPDYPAPGTAIHEMGTARMGDDPTDSVVNRWNQLHDAPNLFVTDGAAMSSSSCVNPSLTFMAFTARAADHAIGLVKSNQL